MAHDRPALTLEEIWDLEDKYLPLVGKPSGRGIVVKASAMSTEGRLETADDIKRQIQVLQEKLARLESKEASDEEGSSPKRTSAQHERRRMKAVS